MLFYPDGAQVHGLLDEVMVVVQTQSHYVNRCIKGPSVRVVPL